MTAVSKILAGGIGLAALAGAAPAAAQYYPGAQGYGYGGYGSGYGGGLGAIIEALLGGNRYARGVDQRALVERCIAGVNNRLERRSARYRNPYGAPYGYGGYQGGSSARVVGITDIDRRSRSLTVRGVATAGGYAAAPYGSPYGAPYGQAYGYGYGQGYGQQQAVGELAFRCDVDRRGRIRNIDINRNRNAYGRYGRYGR